MRILHVLDHSIPLHSGYAFRTLGLLREQRKLGWQTFHLTTPKHTGTESDEEEVEGWHFYRTRPAPAVFSWPFVRELALMRCVEKRLEEVAGRVHPDVIHAHSPVLNAIPALRVGRRLNLPVVYEVRAFWEDAAVDHGIALEGGVRYRLTRAFETYALKRANHVTTICKGLRDEIVSRGIPSNKVTVIPNAVDIDSFAPGRIPNAALKNKLGLHNGSVVGFIGSFYAYEGLDLLISALPRIIRERPDVSALLVGGGLQEAALKAAAARLGLGNKVIFAGRVPHDQVQQYYDLIDILVYPRHSIRLTELVTPLKPLEAMAQGRLLVASDVGGHRELIDAHNKGLLFKAGDVDSLASAVLSLLNSEEQWPLIRQASRRFVEDERTWTASVGGYQDVYQRLLAGRNR